MAKFSELDLHPALAQAIAARGYEEALPVQSAVLEETYQARDLLVSSQTGSGKTLAFGMLLAQDLLPAASEKAAPPRGRDSQPTGLVITPTRELANQVRTELAWLFAKTHLRIAAFTGGSDIRRDMKLLQAGSDLVVGTPGRLVDLLTRKSLRLDAVSTVVLDEADEMLDMGFQEDLETLLGAATARARTLMFSATLPQPILSMAARYQKEALRLDVRPEGAGAFSHEDIEYVAHLTAIGDHLPAVINVLRANGDGRAIVFGTTREGVAALHEALVRRGFQAVVLSGDRAQHERNRALAALRSGEAKVLVATNVAARGLDLPEVDLVVHADLPLSTEDLTHRSGRTGRAGRKGRSVVIANLAERRKAERLMSNARVKFTWTEVPSAAVIAQAALARFEAALQEEIRAAAPGEPAVRALAERLSAEVDRDALLTTLLRRELERLPKGEAVNPVQIRSPQGAHDPFPLAGPRASHTDFARDSVHFRVNLGRQSDADPGRLLSLICRRGNVTRREVGAIRVGLRHSEFEIAGSAAEDFTHTASQPDPRAPHVWIERVSSSARPEPREQRRPSGGPARPTFKPAEPRPVQAAPKPAVPSESSLAAPAPSKPSAPPPSKPATPAPNKPSAPPPSKPSGSAEAHAPKPAGSEAPKTPAPAAPAFFAMPDRKHRRAHPVLVSHKPARPIVGPRPHKSASAAHDDHPRKPAHAGFEDRPHKPTGPAGRFEKPVRAGKAPHPGYEGQPLRAAGSAGGNRPYKPAHRKPGAIPFRPFSPRPFHPGKKKKP
jgi:ATP-dependent RNA helicase DeaD